MAALEGRRPIRARTQFRGARLALALACLLTSRTLPSASLTEAQEPPAPKPPAAIVWLDWTEDAFQRAEREKKPILLNIRAGWSRTTVWMEEKVYTDPEVIQLVTEKWIPIQVDRERRPDLDLRYQYAVSVVAPGGGGWPVTAMLGGDGKLLFGASLIPADDRGTRPGLRTLLRRSADLYAKRPEMAAGTQEVVRMAFERSHAAARKPDLSHAMVDEIVEGMTKAFDRVYGGFGPPPRAPAPFALELAATLQHRGDQAGLKQLIVTALEGMSRGAIFDRVGGGFHRSAAESAWRRPEFEKLLTYNATHLMNYMLGYQTTGEAAFRKVAEKTLDYIMGTLRDPDGGFYVAQHAVSSADEPKGVYYSWTLEEFKKAVPAAEQRAAAEIYDVTAEGDVLLGPPARSLLYMPSGYDEVAARLSITAEAVRKAEDEILKGLAAARASRAAPPVERSIYIDSSSLATVAMFEAARVLGRQDAHAAGIAALDRMLAAPRPGGSLRHRLQPPPDPSLDPTLAQDHLMLARAALVGYEVTGERKYLDASRDLVDRAITLFWDGGSGGFFDTVDDPKARGYLSLRRRILNDIAYPSLNSLAAALLDRLRLYTGEESYGARAEQCLKVVIATVKEPNHTDAGLGLALEFHLRPPNRYIVVGRRDDEKTRRLEEEARRAFDPGKVVLTLEPGRDDAAIEGLRVTGGEVPYVVRCEGERCSEPSKDVSGLSGS